jgi:hypothetical protein
MPLLSKKFFYLAIALMCLVSCEKKNTQGRLIPKDAGIVMLINGKALGTKMPWKDLKNNPAFPHLINDSSLPVEWKALFEDPGSAGIDIQTDLIFFIKKDEKGSYFAFEGSIKDEELFKKFNQSLKEKGSATEKNGINYISSFPVCIGWSKAKFVYVADAPEIEKQNRFNRNHSDSMNSENTISKPRDVLAACQSLFDLNEKNSLSTDKRFTNLVQQTGDVQFWMNFEALKVDRLPVNGIELVNMDKLLKGSITTGSLSFDIGKITIKSMSYAGDELTKIYKNHSGGKINEELLQRLPGNDMIAALALNFKPEALKEILKLLNLDGLMNVTFTTLGFNTDDFVKANKGDLVVSISDLSFKKDTINSLYKDEEGIDLELQKPDINFVFATSIGNKSSFNKLIRAGRGAGERLLNEKLSASFFFNNDSNFFAFSNKRENADKFITGKKTPFDFISKISGDPIGGYINLQSVLRSKQFDMDTDSVGKAMQNASLKIWDNIFVKGGNFNNGGLTFNIELNLVNKTTGSLQQLNEYGKAISNIKHQEQERLKAEKLAFDDFSTGKKIENK